MTVDELIFAFLCMFLYKQSYTGTLKSQEFYRLTIQPLYSAHLHSPHFPDASNSDLWVFLLTMNSVSSNNVYHCSSWFSNCYLFIPWLLALEVSPSPMPTATPPTPPPYHVASSPSCPMLYFHTNPVSVLSAAEPCVTPVIACHFPRNSICPPPSYPKWLTALM